VSLGDTVMGARPRRWRRLALLGILLLAVLVVWLLSSDLPLEAWLAGLRGWIAVRGWWGALCLVVVIAIWNLLLPPTPLQFLAAAVYGVVGGMLVFYLGATLAVIAVAGIVRTWGREVIERQLTRRPRIHRAGQLRVTRQRTTGPGHPQYGADRQPQHGDDNQPR